MLLKSALRVMYGNYNIENTRHLKLFYTTFSIKRIFVCRGTSMDTGSTLKCLFCR